MCSETLFPATVVTNQTINGAKFDWSLNGDVILAALEFFFKRFSLFKKRLQLPSILSQLCWDPAQMELCNPWALHPVYNQEMIFPVYNQESVDLALKSLKWSPNRKQDEWRESVSGRVRLVIENPKWCPGSDADAKWISFRLREVTTACPSLHITIPGRYFGLLWMGGEAIAFMRLWAPSLAWKKNEP